MSGDDSSSTRRVKPDGTAWRDAQKAVSEKNDAVRKRAAEDRTTRERLDAARTAQRQRDGNIAL